MVYTVNKDYLRKISDFDGAPVYRPKYRCAMCNNPVKKRYTKYGGTGKCWFCAEWMGIEDVTRIYSVGIYLRKEDQNSYNSDILTELSDFSREILSIKNHSTEWIEKMSELFAGIMNLENITKVDLLVIPPSSSSGDNHMQPLLKEVSELTGIEGKDIIQPEDEENHPEIKEIEDPEKRREKLRDAFICTEDVSNERVLILDDIATTCSTMVGVSNSLYDMGADDVLGIVLGRNTSIENLKNQNIVEER